MEICVKEFIEKNSNSKIPKIKKLDLDDKKISDEIINKLPKLRTLMDNQELNLYLKEVIKFSFNANKYFNDQAPWKLKKNNPEKMNMVLYNILNQIRAISILLYPIIPSSAAKILDILNISQKDINLKTIENINFLVSGKELKKSNILFRKVENDN